ncbi:TPR-like protein [Dunaliella salina]|uniref:TPR-like protein n=1 Tax=Dunaliella salina TaxID=3046 RepID=A0ABQ7GMX0_DUNSA|nr:TPR-like protein [Dunaliella salina]|eukprot:KAF5835938.1 TPR-like protein [Dunaliella salina]
MSRAEVESAATSVRATRHKAGHDLSYQRHVPKFLQKYSHLLGKGAKGAPGNADGADEDEPVVANAKRPRDSDGEDDDDGEDNIEEDALRRAMEDNPELSKEFEGKLQQKLGQARAATEKDAGNRAFASKQYAEAVEHFTKCIELDPGCEIYWSNRSAAYGALEKWTEALKDARKAVELKPNWAKGHSRVAAACWGLKLYSDAREAYERGLKLEPDDHMMQRGLEKAEAMEAQSMRDHKHVFFSKKQKLAPKPAANAQAGGDGGLKVPQQQQQQLQQQPKVKKSVLSFADDEEAE